MLTRIKDHRLRTGTVSTGIEDLMDNERADISYTDPPWGPSLETYFYNKIEEPSFPKPPTLLLDVMTALKTHTKEEHPIVVEYGRKWDSQVLATAKEAGLNHVCTVTATYAGGLFNMYLFNAEPKFDYKQIPETMTGKNLVKLVVASHAVEGGILFDPCCGLGLFAQVALENKMRFYGNEPNSKRMAVTAQYISRRTQS